MTDPIPHSVEAEQAVIGSLLIDPDAIDRVLSTGLSPLDFHAGHLALIYRAMLTLHKHGIPIADPILVAEELRARGDGEKVGGLAALLRMIADTPTSIYAEHYAGVVKRCAMQRQCLALAGRLARAAHAGEGTPQELAERMTDILANVSAHSEQKMKGVLR